MNPSGDDAFDTIFDMAGSPEKYPSEIVLLSLVLGYTLLAYLGYLCLRNREWGWLAALLAGGFFLPSLVAGIGFWLFGWVIFLAAGFGLFWLLGSRKG